MTKRPNHTKKQTQWPHIERVFMEEKYHDHGEK